ncbi:phosphoribosylanthranilate isomerase [Rudanella paleaurantiibacter]|uniref:N-(5'-phosphoribosyl)anthranilate isomerase n=1 Tax=Rudanella paleaurantiibacter TaxID=2614655 RepID=A0A7J5TT17_9BACT|nr:phosphoribosylanthranilate isomerase [Rudanella paleaurantiibacter]KAB7726167.1 phosphoribosylanthranilate isomerase [Rudanella paleaurantiibacter]
MNVKVCGLRDADNLKEVAALNPDFVGFIFYDKSPRFVGEELDVEVVRSLPRNIRKVGVFVNASPESIIRNVKKYDLQYVQLHGTETPDFCKSLRMRGINIIKAFRVDETFNFSMLNNYKLQCDFFLFDAKGEQPGGNGFAFDWSLLSRYDNEKPFFISGGIGLNNLADLEQIRHLKLYGVDVNSQVEVSPGVKDIEKLKELISRVRPVEEEEEV